MNAIFQALGLDTNQLQQQAVEAQQQLTLAFQILIVEGAAAVLLLVVIAARQKKA